MSYVKRLKKLGKDICPEGSIIRGRTIREVIKSIDGAFNGGESSEPITDLTGTTWYFNETIDPSMLVVGHGDIRLNFISGTNNYTKMASSGFDMTYDSEEVYVGGAWSMEAWRTIEIIDGNDVTDSDVIVWLQTHATLVE